MLNRALKGTLNLFFFTLLLLYSTNLFAFTFQMNQMKPVVTFSGGVAAPSNLADDNTIRIGEGFYAYSNATNKRNAGVFGAFVGEEFMLNPCWIWQLGLAYYYEKFTAKGTVFQGFDIASADTYDYTFDVQSQQVVLETKLLLATMQRFHPYVSLGLGAAYNNAKSWKVNFPIFLTFSPLFSENSETNFTYNVGLGFDVDMGCNVRLGVGYRYRHLGRARIEGDVIDVTPFSGSLSESNIHTNEILAQLTYTFV